MISPGNILIHIQPVPFERVATSEREEWHCSGASVENYIFIKSHWSKTPILKPCFNVILQHLSYPSNT